EHRRAPPAHGDGEAARGSVLQRAAPGRHDGAHRCRRSRCAARTARRQRGPLALRALTSRGDAAPPVKGRWSAPRVRPAPAVDARSSPTGAGRSLSWGDAGSRRPGAARGAPPGPPLEDRMARMATRVMAKAMLAGVAAFAGASAVAQAPARQHTPGPVIAQAGAAP